MCMLLLCEWYCSTGDLVSTVEFQPIQGQTMQEEKVNITITDDNIALEDDEILRFSLSNPVGTKITAPSTVDVEITDDDGRLIHLKNYQNVFINTYVFTFSCNCLICLFLLYLQ